jgi:hypothetical protein
VIGLEIDHCPTGKVGCPMLEGKVDYPFDKASAIRPKQYGDFTA